MKNRINIFILLLFCMIIASCTKTETEAPEEELINGTFISQDGFRPGNEYTRSSLIYDTDGLVFKWKSTDKVGIFPTSIIEGETRTDNNHNASQISFNITKIVGNGQLAEITAQYLDFKFADDFRYTGYVQFQPEDTHYYAVPFDFSGQIQRGYVDMGAYYNGNLSRYRESEEKACGHLSGKDYMISPEMKTDDQSVRFQMRHIGAVARFFLLAPMKKLKIKELKLISNNNIFCESGTIDLTSHPYNEDFAPSTTPLFEAPVGEDQNNYGVSLPPYSSNQLERGTATNCLTLRFDDGINDGVYTLYGTNVSKGESTWYGSYFISYLMMYPIRTTPSDNVYIYVTAEDESGHELYFRTGKLLDQQMYSGYVYQWTNTTEADTPIELTATLQSWQEVASGAIETDLEK